MSSGTGTTEPQGPAIVWRLGRVVEVIEETHRARTLVLDVPDWPGHRAGQHVDVRLTAEDGYQAQRSYSIASAPEDPVVRLTVERLEDGEVSPYLTDVVEPGDELELRGPIGRWFTWRERDGGPLLLVAGGSGLVPLMAMLRHRAARGSDVPAHVLVSARSVADLLFADELGEASVTLTRAQPDGWAGYARRVDADMLREVGPAPAARPLIYVCGSTPFVEHVADTLVACGHDASTIRAERFGPTG